MDCEANPALSPAGPESLHLNETSVDGCQDTTWAL